MDMTPALLLIKSEVANTPWGKIQLVLTPDLALSLNQWAHVDYIWMIQFKDMPSWPRQVDVLPYLIDTNKVKHNENAKEYVPKIRIR